MTKEQYESLPLVELRALAKARKMRGVSSLRKEQLIGRLLEEDLRGQKEDNPSGKPEQKTSDIDEKEERKQDAAVKETGYRSREEAGYVSREEDAGRKETDGQDGAEAQERRGFRRNRNNTNTREYQNHSEYGHRGGSGKRNEASAGGKKEEKHPKTALESLDSGNEASGILEVLADGYGFIRSENFLPGEDDVYVSPSQIRRFGLKTGDLVCGNTRLRNQNEKFSALLYIKSVNGLDPEICRSRPHFESMTPIFPNKRIRLERPGGSLAMRIVDLVSPIGKGQRGMIVSPPKAGKTTLLKDMARSILTNNPEMHLIFLLIDERPEEVTDIKETVQGDNVEVIYSTFDELPEHHKRVSEMVIERAKRLVENQKDVIIFIDSITRLTRAYNQVVPPSGRTLSGGLDPAALHMPKRFFGAARNLREGGSLTILATALVETGSKMDDVVYEEFKGTGNMELILDRKLQERRVFPAIDIARSGTRREDLLLDKEEQDAVNIMRRSLNSLKSDEAAENIIRLFSRTKSNREIVQLLLRKRNL